MTDLHQVHDAIVEMKVDVSHLKKHMQEMADAMKQLAVLETKHQNTNEALSRAFNKITELDNAIRKLQIAQPVLNLTSKWVVTTILGVLGLLSTIAGALIIDLLTKGG